MSEWKEYKLSDIATILNKKRIPLNSIQRAEIQGKYPYYGASGVVDYVNDYIFDGQYVLVSEDGENLRSRQTPIAFIVNGKFWVNNHAHILQGNDELINEFIVYYFQNLNINPFITGAVQPKLNLENLLSIPIFMPERKERLRVTSLIHSLTTKIENLRRQNETLEAIAQTLFKHWFIDFEFPDADGKPYKSSGGEMVDSAIGDIPEGWRVGKLKDVSDITSSKRIFSSEYVESGIPFYRSKEIIELHAGQNVTTELYISVEKFNEIKSKFDVPKTGEILLTSVGTIGIAYLIDKNNKFYFKDGNLTWIKNLKNGFSGVVIYYWLKSASTQNKIKQNTIGSTQKALTIQALGNISIFIPDSKTLNKYTKLIEIVNSKIETNIFQIQTITKTRDALLPKLMSGQLRVKE